MDLKNLIDKYIEHDVLSIPGPIIEEIKEKYAMTRARMNNELFLEDGERTVWLRLEFSWQTLKTDKRTIQRNEESMDEIETAFDNQEWHVFERKSMSLPLSGEAMHDDFYFQDLSIKKGFCFTVSDNTTEAEKNK